MRGYDRDEVEDYDEYEDYGEEQEEEEEGEYEHEDEVERKPSAEELKYLQLRERIKERIRQKHQKQSDSSHNKSQDKKTKLPSNNYGSFFGSSQPVVAQRVIEESKSLLENQHLAFQVSNSHDARKKTSSTASGPKTGVSQKLPKVKNELQLKVQKLKDTRDYSFLLSDDAEPPAPTKEPTPRNGFTPRSGFLLMFKTHEQLPGFIRANNRQAALAEVFMEVVKIGNLILQKDQCILKQSPTSQLLLANPI
uniref:Uncharacterized protein MANES_12G120000 n=1 Tax=Rhizophora mucronata TaxID=61149 RepID=A0A2P2LET3_RHIMU